jgi:hypothetical protein
VFYKITIMMQTIWSIFNVTIGLDKKCITKSTIALNFYNFKVY